MSEIKTDDLLYEVFIRSSRGLEHRHFGSVYAADAEQALQLARDCYLRRREGASIWIVPSKDITAMQAGEQDEYVEPLSDTDYRHASDYRLPKEVDSM